MTTNLDARIEEINRRHRQHRRWFALAIVAGVLLNSYLFWVASGPEQPADALMEFTHAAPTRMAELCPGEVLDYTVALEVNGPGVFAIDISVWRMTPPAVALWSETRRVVFSEPTAYVLKRQWVVPAVHPDLVTGAEVPWLPGQYERRHAITTVSRSTEPSIVTISFSIRGGCP